MSNAALQDRWSAVMMNTYGAPALAVTHGRGSALWDADGREYLDLIAGIATSSLGHAHPAIVAAVADQVARLGHSSNLFVHQPGVALAERLVGLVAGYGLSGSGEQADTRVFFSQDGATANEAALKIARRHGWDADPSGGKLEVIAANGSFHGRTMGALAVTGNPAKREPFEPLPGPVTFVDYGDAAALGAAVGAQTAAVILEPVLGEGGVVPAPPGYLAAARAAADEHGALLIVDEVQSGIGRTGEWFASLAAGVRPDVLTLAKGLAGGLPLGAVLAFDRAAELLGPGSHGTTFGGNPVSCAAALAVIDTIDSDGLLEHVRLVGALLSEAFAGIDHPLLAGRRGAGLWIGLALAQPRAAVVERLARDAGFLVNAVRPDTVRLAPPLILTQAEALSFADALPRLLDEASEVAQ